jgi:hypothetical protein
MPVSAEDMSRRMRVTTSLVLFWQGGQFTFVSRKPSGYHCPEFFVFLLLLSQLHDLLSNFLRLHTRGKTSAY